MDIRYIILLYLFTLVKSNRTNIPEVYEEIKEDFTSNAENNTRVARHPKLHERYLPHFDYKKTIQQDPQKLRYAQQQQVDSYVRAYHQQQNARINSRSQNEPKPSENGNLYASTGTDRYANTRQKSENIKVNFYPIEIDMTTNNGHYLQKKVAADLKTTNQFSDGNKSPLLSDMDIQKQASNIHQQQQPKKVARNPKLGYQVNEDIDVSDQDVQPSTQRESRIYVGKEEILKTDHYPATLSPNYLTKPRYVFANPHLVVDPKLLAEGLQYSLPENHQFSSEGFQPATKSDIDALSALLGKNPQTQLEGLNELLGHQQLVNIQPQALVGLKDYTPIKEEVVDIANIQSKPNVQIQAAPIPVPQIDTKAQNYLNQQLNLAEQSKAQNYLNQQLKLAEQNKAQNYINQQLKLAEQSKNAYAAHDNNLQYASQYAFGYKIRDFHSGSNFGHEEMRDGHVAKGHYHVLLPDGRLQNVDYWADPTGYHAKVTYTSVAHH